MILVTVHGISDRQEFHSSVAIRKLAVTKFYPYFMKLRNSSGASAFVRHSSQSTSSHSRAAIASLNIADSPYLVSASPYLKIAE